MFTIPHMRVHIHTHAYIHTHAHTHTHTHAHTHTHTHTVRKVLYCRSEAESLGGNRTDEKMGLYERLGDMCCRLKAYRAAIAFYGKLLSLAEARGVSQRKLSAIYVSLARTHTDCEQFSQALSYYDRELRLCARNPKEVGGWSNGWSLVTESVHRSVIRGST